MKNRAIPSIESLEGRALFSTALAAPSPDASTATSSPQDTGFTLHLTESVPFMGELAFHPSPVLDPPYQLMGSINWGDGTTSKGTEQLTAGSDAIGYETIGSHTYTKAGTFKIVTTLSLVSILPPPTLPTIIVSKIDSTAIVAKSQSPLGGVQFSVFANQQFTEKVGTFAFNNTNLALSASIDWGDGVTSAGTITRTTGDVYKVVGTHTYSHKGTYKPHIIVTARPVSVPGEPTPLFIVLVASFHSIIDVKALT